MPSVNETGDSSAAPLAPSREAKAARSIGSRLQAPRSLALWVLVALLAHGTALVVGSPLRGMADNGDFWRVGQPAGLLSPVPIDELQHRFVQPTYARVPAHLGEGFSSAALLAWMAASLRGSNATSLELWQVGGLYMALVAVLLSLSLWRGLSPLSCAFLAWVLIDPGYLLFFNSLYADASALLGVLAVVAGLWCVGRPRRRSGAALVVAGVFLATWSKQGHVAIGLPAALALLSTRAVRSSLSGRLAALACVVLTLTSAFHFDVGTGHRFPAINNYHAVFRGIAEVSSEPDVALEQLHLAPEHRSRTGSSYFSGPVPADLTTELGGLSRPRLAALYLGDPGALGRALRRAQRCLSVQDRYLGNRVDPGYGGAQVYDEPWSFTLVREALLQWPPAFLAFWSILGGWLIWRLSRPRTSVARDLDAPRAALAFLWLTIVAETVSVVLGDGFFAMWRHLTVARFALDLALAILAARLVERGAHAFTARVASQRADPQLG